MSGLEGSIAAATPTIIDQVSKAGATSYVWLKKKIVTFKQMTEVCEQLEKKMKRLADKRDEYKSTKMSSESLVEWLSSVGDIEKEVKEIIAKSKKSSRMKHGNLCEKMQKMVTKVAELLEQGDNFLVDPERFDKMKAPNIKGIKSREEVLHNIVDWLKNDKVKRIGIDGTLGIGKTVIMRNLNNHAEVAEMFDIIIWLKVSTEESEENFSREHLQNAIMRRLKLGIECTNNADEGEKMIFDKLKDKKYLLLLDDVKEEFDLSQLGIPAPDGQNGSKMVLTTRHVHVAVDMDVDQKKTIPFLSEEEARKMFQGFLKLPKPSPMQVVLANYLCDRCGGHPLYIETVAKTFREKNNVKVWADGVNSYRDWPEKDCQGIPEFYRYLKKFCYDQLDDDMKICFLYGALYPEDRDIYNNYLVECWVAEILFQKENSYVRGHVILDELKNVSFEEGKSAEYVRMQKCFRQVALDILSNNHEYKCLVKTGETLEGPPNEVSWKQKNWISIVDSGLEKLPCCPNSSFFSALLRANCPNCDKLSTLFLQNNSTLTTIPSSFFGHMKSLRVLDLSHTGIKSLPQSMSELIKLKVLNLSECKHLMGLEKVEHVEALDLRGSGIIGIPHHIENLGGLRHLQVSFTKSRNDGTQELGFNEEKISKLSSLESLVIDVNSKSLEQYWSKKVAEKIIEAATKLEKFTSLKFSFPNEVEDLIEVVSFPPTTTLRIYVHEEDSLQIYINKSELWKKARQINSFQFFIGCKDSKHSQIPEMLNQYPNYIKYCDGIGFNALNLKPKFNADTFELVNHKTIKKLSDFPVKFITQIRGCSITSCSTIESIGDTTDNEVLQNLEHLYIMSVPKLKSIWNGPMRSGNLSKLKTLVLSSCPVLIKIFPRNVIQQLTEIQRLKIENCPEIEEIISSAEIVINLPVLPKLEKMTLLDLPKLKSIYVNESLEWQSLENLEIYECPSLLKLPFNKHHVRRLKSIEAEKTWLDALQNEEVREQLQKIFK